ncbi:E3 ubiquitin-protein ligase ATL41 [Sesamum angolense]|uniref:RING-type E3 ubiquitin transferase n=1 Tax=Sesamum angolense TaxID=2727404 RepID=A0AAE2BHX9_9LAMI|nr:E3 ubiquitin-protein ligase ATL41 [Sesamum angolense]
MGMDEDDRSPFFPGKHNNNVNSKIMLIAIISLSFVVILVALLHIYARCMLRRQARRQAALRRLGFITQSANVQIVEPPKTGLDPSIIAALPVFVFKQTDGTSNEMGSVECSVCISILEDGETARTLPNCKHTFHAECIDKWFGSNSTCPICRTEAEPRLVAGAPPSAPPLEGPSDGDGTQPSSSKVSGSSSRLSSFRWILNRERSSRRIHSQSCGQEEGLPDLERQ